MIAIQIRTTGPDGSEQRVYLPLYFNHHTGEWVTLVSPSGFYRTQLGAARRCYQDWLMKWSRIQELMRHVRVYCDHPEFAEFEGDGIDAGMIRGSVQELADAIELGDPDIRRLFGEVEEDDRVRIGDVLHGFDPETNGLREIPDDARRAPDAFFLRIIGQGFTEAENITSRPVSQRGVADGIDALRLRLQPADDGREAIQYLADLDFTEAMARVLEQVRARTGHGVSAHGLDELILVLRFWRQRQFLANGYNSSDTDVFWEDEDLEPDPQSGDPDGVVLRPIQDDESVVPARPVDPDELGDRDSLAGGSGPHVVRAAEVTDPASDEPASEPGDSSDSTPGSDSDEPDSEPDDPSNP